MVAAFAQAPVKQVTLLPQVLGTWNLMPPWGATPVSIQQPTHPKSANRYILNTFTEPADGWRETVELSSLHL